MVCPAAYLPFLADLAEYEALIAWDVNEEEDLNPSQLRFKPIASQAWETADVGQNQYFDLDDWEYIREQIAEIDELNRQLTYVAQLQTLCLDSLWSDWSPPVLFCLECTLDDSLKLVDVTNMTANILGLAQANAVSYAFDYRMAGQEEWMLVTGLNQPLLLLSDLQAETGLRATDALSM